MAVDDRCPDLTLSLATGAGSDDCGRPHQTMTVFYGGRVCVFRASESQAREIVLMAKREMDEAKSTNQPPAPPSQLLISWLPMKLSLQRFLQKRKARIHEAAAPYGGRKDKFMALPMKLQQVELGN